MLSKRHTEIMRMLTDEGTVTISELATRLGVSLETVRRDVRPLTENGAVLKIHGAVGLGGTGRGSSVSAAHA
jgi:DeoR family glycerol-3-phosphate regulon repressor